MARFAAVLLVAAFGAAAATNSCSGGVCIEVQAEDTQSVGVELLQRGKERKGEKQIPGLSGIIDAGRSAINNVTDSVTKQVNSIVSNVSATVTDQAKAAASSLTSTAATAVASTLNTTILVIGAQTESLFTTCETLKKNMLEKMSKTKADAYARLDVLEEQVNDAIGQVLPIWDNISSLVVTSSSVATTALASVGQEEIAEKLNASLSIALEQANSVAESLENVSAIMDSIRNVTEQELSKGLAQVQDTLQVGLSKADSFATRMSTAFGDLTDEAAVKIAAAIPGVDAAPIDEAFDSVDATVKQVTDDLVDGPRQLVGGLSESVGMVEATLHGGRSSAHRATSYIGLALLSSALVTAL